MEQPRLTRGCAVKYGGVRRRISGAFRRRVLRHLTTVRPRVGSRRPRAIAGAGGQPHLSSRPQMEERFDQHAFAGASVSANHRFERRKIFCIIR